MAFLINVISSAGRLYSLLIFVYILTTWFPPRGIFYDIYRALRPIVEPYLEPFRKAIPPIGGVDFSPIIAMLVLNIFVGFITRMMFNFL